MNFQKQIDSLRRSLKSSGRVESSHRERLNKNQFVHSENRSHPDNILSFSMKFFTLNRRKTKAKQETRFSLFS